MDEFIKWLAIGGTILGIGILFVGFFTGIAPTNLELISRSFSNIFLGLGGLFAAAGGLTVVAQYLDNQKIKQKIDHLRKKYPESAFGNDLQVIAAKSDPGRLFLLDKRGKPLIRWIGNRDTYHDLWFNDMNKTIIDDLDFAKYDKGGMILTKGVPGT